MSDNKVAFEERKKRVDDAIALKEPDRVPIAPFCSSFPYYYAGYTTKEVNYDFEKAKDAYRKYLTHFQPDMVTGPDKNMSGQMPLFDQLGFNWLHWAGQDGIEMSDETCFQCVDKEWLREDEYPEFLRDLSGWTMRKYLPRAMSIFEPLANIDLSFMHNYAILPLSMQFAYAGLSDVFRSVEGIAQQAIGYYTDLAQFSQEIEQMGFIPEIAATAPGAFDTLSCLRGTVELLTDTIAQPENVAAALEQIFPSTLFGAIANAERSNGRLIMIPLMCGDDMFLSDEAFETLYWPTLLRQINGLVDAGLTPWVYTEGTFDTRLEFLKQIPKGKCLIHFDKGDLRKAKKELGDIACLSGGINSSILWYGTKQEVIDVTKENIEILAPGGGYIFNVGNCLDRCKPELVEAMFDTVREYGRY